MDKRINILIVHFNTPLLTECLVKSINKFTPNSNIYIFDNSDKKPFTYRQDNIHYIDNTKGQVINFDEWLKSFPNRGQSNGKQNGFGSAKHCYTIQKCMEMIGENFILMDSDILLKKDVSALADENFVYVGRSEYQTNCKNPAQHKIKRILPFLCFINVKRCEENGIRYFNENYMNGLHTTAEGDLYDTGGGFLKEIESKGAAGKEVNINDYMVHYNAGSWRGSDGHEWLERNRNLYSEPIIISLTTHGARIKYIIPSLKSLLSQTHKADRIVLNICEKEKNLITSELSSFIKANHIELYLYQNDIGPHAKYFYTMKRFRNACVVTVDDDIVYTPDMVASLYEDYKKNRHCIIARRVHKILYNGKTPLKYEDWAYEYKGSTAPSFDIFPTGVGGVLYPPDILKISDDCLPDIRKSLYADDVYLKYRSMQLNVKSKWVKNYAITGRPVKNTVFFKTGLAIDNNIKKRNDTYVKALNMQKHASGNKKVIYTCITGNYEPLDNPIALSEGYDYVCFTDSNLIKSSIWETRPIPEELKGLSSVKKQRCIKINPHKYLPEYDLSIWVDGCIKLLKDVNAFIKSNCSGNASVFIPTHPQRKCIYEEMKTCIKMKKDTEANIAPQKTRYKEEKFPENYGLVQSNIIIRKHNNPDCIKLMDDWWTEVKNGSHRDQLSFNYVVWKNPDIKVVCLDKATCNSQYFKWDSSHGKRKSGTVTVKKTVTHNTNNTTTAVSSVDSIIQRQEKIKPVAPEKKAVRKITPVKTQNQVIRRHLIAKSIKNFLKPY